MNGFNVNSRANQQGSSRRSCNGLRRGRHMRIKKSLEAIRPKRWILGLGFTVVGFYIPEINIALEIIVNSTT